MLMWLNGDRIVNKVIYMWWAFVGLCKSWTWSGLVCGVHYGLDQLCLILDISYYIEPLHIPDWALHDTRVLIAWLWTRTHVVVSSLYNFGDHNTLSVHWPIRCCGTLDLLTLHSCHPTWCHAKLIVAMKAALHEQNTWQYFRRPSLW